MKQKLGKEQLKTAPITIQTSDLNKNHRQRMKDELRKGAYNMPDYKLLEIMLFGAHARCDTRVLAKKLLAITGGDLIKLIHFDFEVLEKEHGISKSVIDLLLTYRTVNSRIERQRLENRPHFEDLNDFVRYCKAEIGLFDSEFIKVLYLNSRKNLVFENTFDFGAINESYLPLEKIIKNVTMRKVQYVVLSHNHPSDDLTPSDKDKSLTKTLADRLQLATKARLLDHIIVSQKDFFSFYEQGWLTVDGTYVGEKGSFGDVLRQTDEVLDLDDEDLMDFIADALDN